jgi:hypothetical protein
VFDRDVGFILVARTTDQSLLVNTLLTPKSRCTIWNARFHMLCFTNIFTYDVRHSEQIYSALQGKTLLRTSEKVNRFARNLSVFFLLLLGPCISLIYAWKPTNTPITHSIYWLHMAAPTRFVIILPSSGSVHRAFWEILNWGTSWSSRTTPLDATRPSTTFYRLHPNGASLRSLYERSLKMAM